MDHLSIAGATLAALLQSCCSSQRPCVGLLFGHITRAVSTQAQDAAADVLVQEAVGHITSTCACVGTHCFYDSTGDVSEEQLAVLLSSCRAGSNGGCSGSSTRQLLGWFSYRPNTPSIPSMLESAVCRKLQAILASSDSNSMSQQQQQQQPLIFGLITSHLEHGGATISLQHRFYAHHMDDTWQHGAAGPWHSSNSSSTFGGSGGSSSNRGVPPVQHPHLQPLELQVLNLGQQDMWRPPTAATAAAGGSSGSNAASASWYSTPPGPSSSSRKGLQQLSALAAALEGLGGTAIGSDAAAAGDDAGIQQQLLSAAQQVCAAGGQLSVVEGMYSSLLEELQLAAAAVTQQQQQLTVLQQQNEVLRQEVKLVLPGDTNPPRGGALLAPEADLLL